MQEVESADLRRLRLDRLFIQSLLRPDYQCLAVSSGEEALAASTSFMPDLVITDLLMEGIDGLQLCTGSGPAPPPPGADHPPHHPEPARTRGPRASSRGRRFYLQAGPGAAQSSRPLRSCGYGTLKAALVAREPTNRVANRELTDCRTRRSERQLIAVGTLAGRVAHGSTTRSAPSPRGRGAARSPRERRRRAAGTAISGRERWPRPGRSASKSPGLDPDQANRERAHRLRPRASADARRGEAARARRARVGKWRRSRRRRSPPGPA